MQIGYANIKKKRKKENIVQREKKAPVTILFWQKQQILQRSALHIFCCAVDALNNLMKKMSLCLWS